MYGRLGKMVIPVRMSQIFQIVSYDTTNQLSCIEMKSMVSKLAIIAKVFHMSINGKNIDVNVENEYAVIGQIIIEAVFSEDGYVEQIRCTGQ